MVARLPVGARCLWCLAVITSLCLFGNCCRSSQQYPEIKEIPVASVSEDVNPTSFRIYVNAKTQQVVVRSDRELLAIVIPRYSFGYDAVYVACRKGGVKYGVPKKHFFSFPRNGAEEAVFFIQGEYSDANDLVAYLFALRD